jgi:5-hydroxyisourate hydrolase
MAGKLTTHVLDTAHGHPAVGMKIVLSKIESTGVAPIKTVFTNSDGRTDDALLEGNDLLVGTYELMFYVGDYYAKYGEAESPRFLDVVPIRFGIANHDAKYHVPLLCSRWAYSTYRGS